MRKKGVDVNLGAFKFQVPEQFKKCTSANVTKLIADLEEADSVDRQQKVLKNFSEILKAPCEDEISKHIRELLAHLFFTTDCKYPIKKTISRILMNDDIEKVAVSFCENVRKVIQGTEGYSLLEKNTAVTNLQMSTTFPKIGQKVLTEEVAVLMPFCVGFLADLSKALTEDSLAKADVLLYTANLIKFFISFVNFKEAEEFLQKCSVELVESCYKVIMNELVQFEVKCNASQILVQAMNNAPEEYISKFEFKTPCLQLLQENIFIIPYYDLASNETAKLSLYTALLHSVPGESLSTENIHGFPVLSYLCLNILDIAKRSSGVPNQVLTVMKTLGTLSKMLHHLPESHVEKLFRLGLDFIWANLDYHIDAVRFNTKEVYKNFIKLAVTFGNKGDSSLIRIVLSYLSDLLINRCSNYIAFNILAEETGTWFVLQYFNSLPLVLLVQMEDVSLASSVCSTYEALMQQHLHEEDDNALWMETWVNILKPMLEKSEAPVTAYYQRLLIYGFQINPAVINSILHYQNSNSINEVGALLGCVRWARKNMSRIQLTQRDNKSTTSSESSTVWRDLLDYKTLEVNMYHQNDEIRIHTLALVVECQKTTEFFSKWELEFLKNFFKYNVTSQDPNTIQQLKALYKKAITRLKEGYIVMKRLIVPIEEMSKKPAHLVKFLRQLLMQEQTYLKFIDSFIEDHLKKGLAPWANMYRRALCLELLAFAQNIMPENIFSQYFLMSDIKPLYTVLNDSYENNILLATSIIKKISSDHHISIDDVINRINNALEKATSLNVSSALSVAYYFSLALGSRFAVDALNQLIKNKSDTTDVNLLAIQLLTERIEGELVVSKDNILNGAKTAPFYGLFYCIRHIIETQLTSQYKHWKKVTTKLVDLCMSVSTVVMPIVNNLNPEGFIPVDEVPDTEEMDESSMAQMLLVFAWRTVKEVSLLLGELASRAPTADSDGNEIFDLGLSAKVADYYRFIFYETKHRGAYEQAAVGFCKLCKRIWGSQNEALQKWPACWVDEVLNMLKGIGFEKIFKKLCSTRRSAGLPFMIIAILTTEPTQGSPVFEKCIRTLLDICKDMSVENERALTHSMNILRIIYRHAQLGEMVSPFIEEGMKIAINGFASSVWGVRNSSTLLFSALMVRIFGVQRNKDSEDMSLKNRMTARVFFMRYPELFNFMLMKMKDATFGSANSLSVHPVLLILARLYPTNVEDEQQLIQYLPLVNICLKHCQYRTRVLAAQASIPLIPRRNYIDYATKLLLDLSDVTLTNNHCHGLILQMIAILKHIPAESGVLNVPSYIQNTFWIAMSAGTLVSHATSALYMDMIVQLSDKFLKYCISQPVFVKLGEILLWKAAYERYHNYTVNTGGHQYRRSRLLLLLQIVGVLFNCEDYLKSLFIRDFAYLCIDSPDIEVSDFTLNVIHCLNVDNPHYIESPLHKLEIIDFPSDVFSVFSKMRAKIKDDATRKLHCIIDKKILINFMFHMKRSSAGPLQVFSVLQHFVCILPLLRMGHANTLSYLLQWVYDCDDAIVCAVFGCINLLLYHSVDSELKEMHLCDLQQAVIFYASPQASLHERLAICQLLVHNNSLFCDPKSTISVHNKIKFWNAVIILLEDSDPIIRNTMSDLVTKVYNIHVSLIAEKAREELIKVMKWALPKEDMLCLLLLWGIRKQYNPVPDDEGDNTGAALSEVLFDKGDLNTFGEDESLRTVALAALKESLWELPSLSYTDHSIFVEEHMYLVSSELYNAIRHSNMFPPESKAILLIVLKGLIEFLQSCEFNTPNFKFNFESRLVMEVINVTFKMDKNPLKHTAADRFKSVFRQIYNIKE